MADILPMILPIFFRWFPHDFLMIFLWFSMQHEYLWCIMWTRASWGLMMHPTCHQLARHGSCSKNGVTSFKKGRGFRMGRQTINPKTYFWHIWPNNNIYFIPPGIWNLRGKCRKWANNITDFRVEVQKPKSGLAARKSFIFISRITNMFFCFFWAVFMVKLLK